MWIRYDPHGPLSFLTALVGSSFIASIAHNTQHVFVFCSLVIIFHKSFAQFILANNCKRTHFIRCTNGIKRQNQRIMAVEWESSHNRIYELNDKWPSSTSWHYENVFGLPLIPFPFGSNSIWLDILRWWFDMHFEIAVCVQCSLCIHLE